MRLLPRVIFVRLLQPDRRPSLRVVMLSGRVKLLRQVQRAKAYLDILVIPLHKLIFCSDEHPSKAQVPIF